MATLFINLMCILRVHLNDLYITTYAPLMHSAYMYIHTYVYGDKILCTFICEALNCIPINIGGIDYVITNEIVTFPPGEVSVSINVFVFEDSYIEENETFIGVLQTIDTTPDHVSIGKPSRAIATGIIIETQLLSKYNTCSA